MHLVHFMIPCEVRCLPPAKTPEYDTLAKRMKQVRVPGLPGVHVSEAHDTHLIRTWVVRAAMQGQLGMSRRAVLCCIVLCCTVLQDCVGQGQGHAGMGAGVGLQYGAWMAPCTHARHLQHAF